MSTIRTLLCVSGLSLALGNVAAAQTPTYPPAGYSPLLFDSADAKYVFRLRGAPWICRGDTFCKPIKIEGVADKDAQTEQRQQDDAHAVSRNPGYPS